MRTLAGQLAGHFRPHEYQAEISAAEAAAQPATLPPCSLASGCDACGEVRLRVRSVGGIPKQDFICAARADALFASCGDGATA